MKNQGNIVSFLIKELTYYILTTSTFNETNEPTKIQYKYIRAYTRTEKSLTFFTFLTFEKEDKKVILLAKCAYFTQNKVVIQTNWQNRRKT